LKSDSKRLFQGEVIAKKLIGVRQLILNRPKRLNALSLSMIKAIIPKVLAWNGSGLANIITLKGNGRALCAGGDVRGNSRIYFSYGLLSLSV
jgi:3-hydroxyisobutyryl-CoA hydrolase